jgi:hypothetical protein
VLEPGRDPSFSVSLHVLETLDAAPARDRPCARDKILRYVLGARHYGTFWTDKWHVSPYYPTSRALIVLPSHVPDYMDAAVDQLLAKQHATGAWEHYAPTAEETALTLYALLEYHREVRRLPHEPLHRPTRYLIVEGGTFQVHYPKCGSSFSAPSNRSATPSTELSPREASGVARGEEQAPNPAALRPSPRDHAPRHAGGQSRARFQDYRVREPVDEATPGP